MSDIQYIISIALGQGFVLAFFLLSSKYYKSQANSWLAIALILLSVLSITDIVGSEYSPSSIWVAFLFHDIELSFLVYVPLYYFFYISTSQPPNERYVNYYFLIPFVIDTLINIGIVVLFPIEEISSHVGIQLFYEIEQILAIVFNAFISYQSYQFIKTNLSASKKRNWIYKIWQSTVVLLLAWILMTFSGYVLDTWLSAGILMLYLLISMWMFWLLYNGVVNIKLIDDRQHISSHLQDKAIRENLVAVKMREQMTVEKGEKNQSDSLQKPVNPALFDGHFDKINAFMRSESLYRNEELSIDDVAQRIDMSSGYVSKIIKKATNKSFPTWINELRVADIQAMFTDKDFDHYTTLAIGLEAGFKSKSAFYAAFKKITGETPAKFRKKKS